MPITDEQLREIVVQVGRRPGHEQVRALLHRLFIDALPTTSWWR
jgi:uncharacterized protein YneF (UPF0154 family)